MDLRDVKVPRIDEYVSGLYYFNKHQGNDIGFEKNNDLQPSEICQKARQTRESFPLNEHKSVALAELVHLDLWGPYKVDRVCAFFNLIKNHFNKIVKTFRSNNGTVFVNRRGDLEHPQGSNGFTREDERVAISKSDSINSKGGIDDMPDTELIQNKPLRRSNRSFVSPNKYNGYVVDSKVKFGLERFVGAMNKEMSSLYSSDTWVITKLPSDKKAIGCKWVYKIKYRSNVNLITMIFLALLVYVDDIVVTGNNVHKADMFKGFWKSKFMIKDLGKLKYFVCIEVVDTNNGIYLSHWKYCLDLLSDFGFLACKPYVIPLKQNLFLSKEPTANDLVIDITEYQKPIGKLIYLTHTRLDIPYYAHCFRLGDCLKMMMIIVKSND
nr:ribonuclease H-like domain-containing protein [Tanacetum cinerariifolium]